MNSNGAMRFNADSNEWVRIRDCFLYGGLEHPNLKQIFSLKSVISQIRFIKRSEHRYQNSFVADKDMHIAVIPVGYADGLNRKLGNQNGQVSHQGYCMSYNW